MSQLNNAPAEFAPPPAAATTDPGADDFGIDLTPGSKIPACPDGMAKLVVATVRRVKSTFEGQAYATVLGFAIRGREDDGTLNVTPSKTDKGKFPWATVLTALGVAFVPGEKQSFKATDLIGKTCQGFVQNEPGKKDPSKKFPKIKALSAE